MTLPTAHTPLSRRRLLLAGALAPWAAQAASPALPPLQVWKDPDCDCCKGWVAHLQSHGFQVTVHETGNAQAQQRLGIPPALRGCHTAEVGGYAIEGHVPAREVLRLLRDKPEALGLAVPGMPIGSPGMDGPAYGGRSQPYQVVLMRRNAAPTVFQNYPG